MRHAPVPIGVATDARGLTVSLPPRFWLLVSLRRIFPRMTAEERAWTYRLPPTVGAAKRVEVWIAEVELQMRADARRRSWTASDAEWDGVAQPARAAVPAPAPAVVELPGEDTGPAVLELLHALARGAVLTAAIDPDGALRYRLLPSGRSVRSAVALRAIRERLVAPGREDLFDPDWSQTWRVPADPAVLAALPEIPAPAPKGKPAPKPRARRAPDPAVEELAL